MFEDLNWYCQKLFNVIVNRVSIHKQFTFLGKNVFEALSSLSCTLVNIVLTLRYPVLVGQLYKIYPAHRNHIPMLHSAIEKSIFPHDYYICTKNDILAPYYEFLFRIQLFTEVKILLIFRLTFGDDVLIKRCPVCNIFIEKNNGCAQMTCRNCSHVFCWYCLKVLDVSIIFILKINIVLYSLLASKNYILIRSLCICRL